MNAKYTLSALLLPCGVWREESWKPAPRSGAGCCTSCWQSCMPRTPATLFPRRNGWNASYLNQGRSRATPIIISAGPNDTRWDAGWSCMVIDRCPTCSSPVAPFETTRNADGEQVINNLDWFRPVLYPVPAGCAHAVFVLYSPLASASLLNTMATPAQQLEVAKNNSTLAQSLSPWADVLSKGAAGIVLVLYSSGFLIVSLHHANYGFVGANPFRPRILAAGAWFTLFTIIPAAWATRYRQLPWISVVGRLGFVLFVFYGLSNALFFTLFDLGNSPSRTPYHHWSYWVWGAGAVIAVVLYSIAWDSKKITPTYLAVVSCAYVLFAIGLRIQGYLIMNDFESGDLALWFFGVFAMTVLALKMHPGGYSGDRIRVLGTDLSLLISVLFVFGHDYYPHIKPSWGGGSPVAVTVYFAKDSPLKPNQSVSAELVDESNDGYYIVGQGDTKAVFVPRSAVSLLYFSDKPSDSKLLK